MKTLAVLVAAVVAGRWVDRRLTRLEDEVLSSVRAARLAGCEDERQARELVELTNRVHARLGLPPFHVFDGDTTPGGGVR